MSSAYSLYVAIKKYFFVRKVTIIDFINANKYIYTVI